MRSGRSFSNGFTLIELLIVVAIIGILVAVAVPNFLAAQVRAKIAKVKSEHHTLALALEQYIVDHNAYPGDQDNDPFHARERGLYSLTTPVAYISDILSLQDPFSRRLLRQGQPNPSTETHAPFYEMGSGSDNPARWRVQCYEISSIGPDQDDDIYNNDEFPFTTAIRTYEPTNGTISDGDLVRFGGDYRRGTWRLNGVVFGRVQFGNSLPE